MTALPTARWARRTPWIAALVAAAALVAGCTVTPTASPGGGATPFPTASSGSPTGSATGTPTPTDPTATATGPWGPATPDPRLARFYDQSLSWTSCGGEFQCATLTVPVSYDDPEGPTIGLAVVRLRTSGEDRLGSLLVNPGGPGGSGVEYARAARAIVSPEVLNHYDIVGFDPRGVASSDPVECLTDEELDRFYAVDGTPDTPAEVAEVVGVSELFGARCQARSPELLPHVGTRAAARDLDILRAAVGDDQLNYLGKSYGTFLGSAYAELFPERVGRMVLDGVLPPDLDAEQITLGQAKAFDVALERFAADCPTHSDCPLPDDPKAGVEEVRKWLASLDAKPLPAQPGRPLNEALASYAVLSYLYFPEYDWPRLRTGLAAGLRGDGEPLMDMLDERIERRPDGTYRSNSTDAFYAISCVDRSVSGGVKRAAELAAEWAVVAPTFGPYLAWGNLPCDSWPVPATDEPHVITAAGAAPIMVVTTKYDPATPYEWGLSLADQLESAALVTWDGDGHTAYYNGDDCVDGAVDAYLVDGDVPEATVACP